MTPETGEYTLAVALLTTVGGTLSSVLAARGAGSNWLRNARLLLTTTTLLVVVASVQLMIAMVQSDFRIQYVAHYSERALPVGYKLAAFWAGQEGSLLLWTLLLCVLGFVAMLWQRRLIGSEPAGMLGTLGIVTAFFIALLLFAANPFARISPVPEDGSGLNPLLQDPGMIIHPPLLFVGYAGYTIPFAMLVGAMVAGRTDGAWLALMRPWSLFAWLFLSAGILWGGNWSYTTLGWGGYWAWDPVENASLLPWLTGTALLHSISIQQQRGIFKRWNFVLISATFVLCIFGTYLTRSGVVSSVHSFGENPIGKFFVAFIAIAIVGSLVILSIRSRELRPDQEVTSFINREGAFLAINVLFVLVTLVTMVGTIFPALSRWTTGREIAVDQHFYNRVVVPLFMVLVGLMAFGPVLRYGFDKASRVIRTAAVPGIISGIIAGIVWAMGISSPWALLNVFLVTLVALVIVVELTKAIYQRSRNHDESYIGAAFQLVNQNRRRYGAQLAHLGVALLVLGVVGSSLFSTKQSHQVAPGDTVSFAGYSIKFVGLREERGENYTAVVADLRLVEPSGGERALHPNRRFYDKAENAYSEVAIQTSLREDLYITLAGWEDMGKITAIQTIVNPLVVWIWIGGIIMACGAVLAMLPKPAMVAEANPQVQSTTSARHAKRIQTVEVSRSI